MKGLAPGRPDAWGALGRRSSHALFRTASHDPSLHPIASVPPHLDVAPAHLAPRSPSRVQHPSPDPTWIPVTCPLACRGGVCQPQCGRTAQNNTPSEVLVFHQTLSTPKVSYIGRIPSSTPQGRTRIIHVFPLGSNNENEFTILSPFYTTRVLRNTLLQYQVQSAEFKQQLQ